MYSTDHSILTHLSFLDRSGSIPSWVLSRTRLYLLDEACVFYLPKPNPNHFLISSTQDKQPAFESNVIFYSLSILTSALDLNTACVCVNHGQLVEIHPFNFPLPPLSPTLLSSTHISQSVSLSSSPLRPTPISQNSNLWINPPGVVTLISTGWICSTSRSVVGIPTSLDPFNQAKTHTSTTNVCSSVITYLIPRSWSW